MIASMTAFASARGEAAPHSWAWELRGVNAKGLDLRLRVPDWLEGLEPALRGELGRALARGSVTLSLRIARAEDAGAPALNPAALAAALDALAGIEAEALARGMTLAPSRAADLLAVRGVLDASGAADDVAPLVRRLRAEFRPLLEAFTDMRRAEGARLAKVIAAQLDRIEALTEDAAAEAALRAPKMAEALHASLARVMEGAPGADEARVAQELALIAVKADVTEEIDRLRAHVAAARDLLAEGGAVGRKLDFLSQEFNREANTLCAKAQSGPLTAIGLDLKAVIDQMREQVQNVE